MFFDVFIYVIVIDRVPVDCAVGMNMGENVTVLTFLVLGTFAVLSVIFMGMAVRNAVVIIAGASSRSL